MTDTFPRIYTWVSFVKFEHTLFSLPLLYAGAVIALGAFPDLRTSLWILGGGTGARTAAMGLNRIIDRNIDARNLRTEARELPRGTMNLAEAWGIVAAGLALYLFSCFMLSPFALSLSLVPLIVFVIYPYMKRFTSLAHFGVGTALALAPLGGFIAVTGSIADSAAVLWLAAFTLFWVAGFDIIYATLDIEFDRTEGLRSLPVWLGRNTALGVSMFTHLLAIGCLVGLFVEDLSGVIAITGIMATGVVLAAEHWLAEQVNLAFFQLNIIVGFLVLGVVFAGKQGW